MGTLMVTLGLAVAESVIMAVLKRFIPILGGALPPTEREGRAARIDQNRFFVAAFFQYLIVIIFISMTFVALPFINDLIEADPHAVTQPEPREWTNLQTAKHIGPHLPDLNVPNTMMSPVIWKVAMVAMVPIMVLTGVFFWPIWRMATALGYDDSEQRKRLHAHAVLASLFIAVWMLLYLYTPMSLTGALGTFVGVLFALYVLSVLTGRTGR